MTIVRVLGTLGKVVIAIGLVILLFGIFQLWGTGVIEARAQQDLGSDFDQLLEASRALEQPAPSGPSSDNPVLQPTPDPEPPAAEPPAEPEAGESVQVAAPSAAPTAAPAPTPTATPLPTEEPLPDPEWLAMLYRDPGQAIARIQIPSLGVDKTVVEGVRVGDLRKGPGHYPATPLPGQEGNAAIAGHRTTYGAPFGDIDALLPGDEILITTIQGEFTYAVVAQGDGHGHIIVPPTAIEVLDQNFYDYPNRLTLTACHPKGSARQRIIVIAELLSEPAPTYPRPDQEEMAETQLADEDLGAEPASEQTVTATPSPSASEEQAPGSDESPPAPATPAPNATPAATPASEHEEPGEEDPGDAGPGEAEPVGGGALGNGGDSGPQNTGTQPAPSRAANPAPVADSFGEGLDGDSDGLIPAILWGLAALAIWFSALFAGRRWRRLPAYGLSALPFLVVLFMAFWHVDQILPSY